MQRVTGWMCRHKPGTAAIILVILTGLGSFVVWATSPSAPIAQIIEKAQEPELPVPEKVYYSPLSGKKVKDENTTKRQVTSIIIENSPNARPQSGLQDAGIIYEAIAEGGITRFAALYQESRPALVGPVRSLRPYYVAWLRPYDATFAHVGGSLNALKEVRNGKYKDIDQFFNPGAYYRSSDRFAPHNVYTSFDRLDALNKSKGFTSSKFQGWPRKPDAPDPAPNAKRISVNISGDAYNSSYLYNAASNSYLRSQGGEPHVNRESKKQLSPKVVVVMEVVMNLGFEDGPREQIRTSGTGEAYIFQDGSVEKATWSKKDSTSPLKFIKNNAPIQLNTGQVWITAIPGEGSVTWQ